jgi:16S rRNA (cytidine1402-2'-O)-methyltransferase
MSGTLYVVATPIGNLEDITLRALRILREVDVVAAEDTRRTGNLLRHYQIVTPLVSLHEHNEQQRRSQLVERLILGESVALVSDAGTPGISDPGALFVRAARDAGVRVDPVPGPSAVTAILSAAGLPVDRFAFAGFPPIRAKDRNNWFVWLSSLPDTPVVCFEAPHRIARTVRELREKFVDRPIIIARELTKAHEQWILDHADPPQRGEFVILVGPTTNIVGGRDRNPDTVLGSSEIPSLITDEQIAVLFGEITKQNQHHSRRAAIKAVALQLGLPARDVYNALERAKN